MTFNIHADRERERILKNDREKLEQEVKGRAKSIGLEAFVPTHGQDPYVQIKDLENEKGHVNEIMGKEREKNRKIREERKKAERLTFEAHARMYFKRREQEEKEAFEKRTVRFDEGELEKYKGKMKMTEGLVLLEKMPAIHQYQYGIVSPENYDDGKHHRYSVVEKGSGCGEVEKGMTVIPEAYAGQRIVAGKKTYLIVEEKSIICEVV